MSNKNENVVRIPVAASSVTSASVELKPRTAGETKAYLEGFLAGLQVAQAKHLRGSMRGRVSEEGQTDCTTPSSCSQTSVMFGPGLLRAREPILLVSH
jgi:hypothetical protein